MNKNMPLTESHENDIFTYSQIISPLDYNMLMSDQHLYISASDKFLAETIKKETHNEAAEVVELGSGPGRILPLLRESLPNAHISAVEADRTFADYAQSIMGNSVDFIFGDVEHYQHPRLVDAFCSQGFHHHVAKGKKTKNYLKNIYNQLRPGGIYVLSDEFLPDYSSEEDREQKVIVWYSHIIAHAILHAHDYLAQEEAKTLLDDLYEGRNSLHVKNMAQINHVLAAAPLIDLAARNANLDELNNLVKSLILDLEKNHNLESMGDVTVDLSRHDYKICNKVLESEVKEAGFTVESVKSFGPISDIGAMVVYILRK
jgi:SAM-dependent methyltransferase